MRRIFGLLLFVVAVAGLVFVSHPAHGQDSKAVNTWGDSAAGDWVEYTLKAGLTICYEIQSVAEDGTINYLHITHNVKGEEIARKDVNRAPDKAQVLAKLPANMDVKWSKATVELTEGRIECDVASWDTEGKIQTIWYSSEVPCGGIIKQTFDGEDSIWVSSWSRDGQEYTVVVPEAGTTSEAEPEPEPELESTPEPLATQDFGPPVTMKLPESIREAMKDQGTAITRLRVYFDENEAEDGISLEYEGMRTEVPVIYAAFLRDDSDRELTYETWSTRDGRYVDLAFEIKTLPAKLEGMEVKVVHSHLQGENEGELASYDITVPPPGEPWDTLRLRGAKPGINRYTLVVSYTNDNGERTEHKGFSHWVVVQAPPMFEFLNEISAKATRSETAGNTTLKADVTMNSSFILHNGIDPNECELRISRKGKRDMNLDDLPAEVRRIIEKNKIPPGWQEVARVDFNEGTVNGQRVVRVEESFVKVVFTHAFAASAAVLPVEEGWEYHFELLHPQSAEPLATWTVNVDLDIKKPADLSSARLVVRATGLAEPLRVGFQKK